jgi:IS5 family transposase
MAQLGLGLDLSTKHTRKREFLDEMRRVVPWSRLIALIEPHYPKGRTGRPPFPIATMRQIHFMQQWFGLSDPSMEEALYDVPLYRDFAGLDEGMTGLPDESTILRFRHLLETHGLAAQMLTLVNEILSEKGLMLRTGSAVDATLTSAKRRFLVEWAGMGEPPWPKLHSYLQRPGSDCSVCLVGAPS